ncbi:MAG: hypothetical protein ACMUIU_06275 [bacterium]
MRIRKAVALSCIIFLGIVIFCMYIPALSQYLPWSWPPASRFPPISPIPLYNYPPTSYYPSTGPFTTSGWPIYASPVGAYSPTPQQPTPTGTCPVGLVTGLTLDEEFGPGASQITRCLIFTYGIKAIYRLNHMEYTPGTPITRTIITAIDDYRITHGTTDFKIAAIIHSSGLPLALNRNAATPHPEAIYNDQQPVIEDLMAKGVKFYL